MKKTILKMFSFFLFLAILFLKPNIVKAQDLEVTCDGSGSCTLSSTNPLFSTSQDGLWYPGKSIAKTLRIRNNHSTDTTTVSTKAQNPQSDSSSCELDKKLTLSIVRAGATPPNSVVWAGYLNDFYQQTSIDLAVFSPSAFDDFSFTVVLPSTAANECQNKTTSFNLTLNFLGETITPTPTPTPTSTPSPGTVLGAGVSAPVCTDTKPWIPSGFTAVAGPGAGKVILSWAPPALPYTYFLIAYSDTSSWPPKWGNPNVGNVNTYTISGLGTGTYWFWLRAGNGCMPGDFVGPVSPGPIVGIPGAPAVAPGFLPGVLGEEATTTEEVLGKETASPTPEISPVPQGGRSRRNIIFAGLGIILLAAGYHFFIRRKRE